MTLIQVTESGPIVVLSPSSKTNRACQRTPPLQPTGPANVLCRCRLQHLQQLRIGGVHRVLAVEEGGVPVMHLTGG